MSFWSVTPPRSSTNLPLLAVSLASYLVNARKILANTNVSLPPQRRPYEVSADRWWPANFAALTTGQQNPVILLSFSDGSHDRQHPQFGSDEDHR